MGLSGRVESYDHGLGALKIFMCFEVVLCHYWDSKDCPFYLQPLSYLKMTAVPVFMIMSFYFCKDLFVKGTSEKIRSRLWRLIFPYVVWGILYFGFYGMIQMILGVDKRVSLSDLGWQLALGSSPVLNPPLWYQADLIILTVVFWVIYRLLDNEKTIAMILILTVVAIVLQYSDINEGLFGRFRYEARYTMGRIAEMIPFAAVGILLALSACMDKMKKHWVATCLAMIISCLFIMRYDIIRSVTSGFGYGGLNLVAIGTMIFIFVGVLPCDRLPDVVKKVIKQLGKYTFGIFCLHFGVGACMDHVLEYLGVACDTLAECVVIFVICYVVCWVIDLMPVKYIRQIVL